MVRYTLNISEVSLLQAATKHSVSTRVHDDIIDFEKYFRKFSTIFEN